MMMMQNRAGDIDRGMILVPSLTEIMPDQAGARLRRVYEETQHTLRVPFVNFIFRVLANYKDYLVPEWDRLRPWARKMQFERTADAIRGAAVFDPALAFNGTWPAPDDLGRIAQFTASIHYVLPKLLLLATAMDEMLNQQWAGTGQGSTLDTLSGGDMPEGIAAGTLAIPMVSPEHANLALRGLFNRIKERHRHPGVATYYRSLGHWPDFLQAVWEGIEQRVGTQAYEARKHAVVELASQAALFTLPRDEPDAPRAYHRSLPPGRASNLRAVLAVFRFRVIPDLLIDVTLVRALLDGPDAASRSQFSLA